ncbi:hypothetical protein B0H11DRAFT_2251394 [Mycena galericulata]|nr:hypothetical protein B0H11DRAFT_2251394 [Mycena galericulata]
MPIYPDFPSNPTQLRQIVADIHEQERLPLKYDSADLPRPDLRHGWIIGDLQREIITKWLLENHPTDLCRDMHGEPHARTSALLSGRRFAWHYDFEGGVTPVHTLDEHGKPNPQTMFFFETNDIIPEDRSTREEWEPLAKALQIIGEPKCAPGSAWDRFLVRDYGVGLACELADIGFAGTAGGLLAAAFLEEAEGPFAEAALNGAITNPENSTIIAIHNDRLSFTIDETNEVLDHGQDLSSTIHLAVDTTSAAVSLNSTVGPPFAGGGIPVREIRGVFQFNTILWQTGRGRRMDSLFGQLLDEMIGVPEGDLDLFHIWHIYYYVAIKEPQRLTAARQVWSLPSRSFVAKSCPSLPTLRADAEVEADFPSTPIYRPLGSRFHTSRRACGAVTDSGMRLLCAVDDAFAVWSAAGFDVLDLTALQYWGM